MISYPRWKIVLVAIVLLIGIFLALPNLFGEEERPAAGARSCGGARAIADGRVAAQGQGRHPDGAFLDQGRLTLRFSSKQDQLKARDHYRRGASQSVHHRPVAGLARSRMDAQSGLEPLEAGPGSSRRRVPGLSGRRAGRGEADCWITTNRISAPRCAMPACSVSRRGGGLPHQSRARAVSRRR
jgi:hypothetical protein